MSGYRVVAHAPLRARNSFGVDVCAPLLIEVDDAAALPRLFDSGPLADREVLLLGGGSNLLFAGDPPGAVLALRGQRIARVGIGDGHVLVHAEAGVEWHACVQQTLRDGLSGLENLALIPGTVGAAPIQNIGAYGAEVGDRIRAVEAFDRTTGEQVTLSRQACDFAYRDSRFKREPARWVVTAVTFALSPADEAEPRTDYAGIADELATMAVDTPTPAQVAEAVCRIRRRKLPDPARIGNAGSFFKNPIVPVAQAEALRAAYSDLPVYPLTPFPADAAAHGVDAGARCKLSAAWLIERCGWKGHRDGDAGVSAQHALVLVNHGAATGAQLLALARRVAASVQDRFGVALEPEPRVVGADW